MTNACICPLLLVVAALKRAEIDPFVFAPAAATMMPLGDAGGGKLSLST